MSLLQTHHHRASCLKPQLLGSIGDLFLLKGLVRKDTFYHQSSCEYLAHLEYGCPYSASFAFLVAYSIFEEKMVLRKVSPSSKSLNHSMALEDLWPSTSKMGPSSLPSSSKGWLASLPLQETTQTC